MLPGLNSSTAATIQGVLTARVTALAAPPYDRDDFVVLSGNDPAAQALGVKATGAELTLVVTDPALPVGSIQVQCGGAGNVLYLDNLGWRGSLYANIRLLGGESAVLFNDLGADGYVALHDVFLRSHRQFLFWGEGATAVGCSIEIEGEGMGVAVGDDALISNGVWIRNYNMHALHDLRSGRAIGRAPVTTVIERHVWLGQDALLLGCERIGTGSVVAARALVNRAVPDCVIVGGTPAVVLREGSSWGRDTYAMTAAERRSVGWPSEPEG